MEKLTLSDSNVNFWTNEYRTLCSEASRVSGDIFIFINSLGKHTMTTTITVRQVVKIHNRQLYLMLPEGFDYEEVEVIVMPVPKPNDNISFWESSDIDMVGKIGQSSACFPEDDEDYSKW
jgi:hypothetical protein